MTRKRERYYWARFPNRKWEPAWLDDAGKWWVFGEPGWYDEVDLEEIGPELVPPPIKVDHFLLMFPFGCW